MLRSRKFLTLILDTVVSLVIYFVVKYVAPALADDVHGLIGPRRAGIDDVGNPRLPGLLRGC